MNQTVDGRCCPQFCTVAINTLESSPYGFASFYPASYLLDCDYGSLAWVGPLVAVILLFIGYRFWQTGLKYYSGTGT